jgi:Fe-S-cluster-containing dehydrogenase component
LYSENAENKLSSEEEIRALITDLNQGNVGVLINLNANPVYHLASDLQLDQAIAKATYSVSLVESSNETSKLTTVSVPVNHALESWGIARSKNGVVDLQQPVIASVFKSRQLEDLLISYLTESTFSDVAYRELIKSYVKTTVYAEANSLLTAEEFWVNSLHDGFAKVSLAEKEVVDSFDAISQIKPSMPSKGMVVALKASQYLGDGSMANVGWLQEVPHPVTKITWDNYAMMSLATMKKLGLKAFPGSGDYSYEVVTVKVNGKSIEIPAFTQPGIAEDQVVIELGYGRSEVGVVGEGVGVNAIPLMSSKYKVSPLVYGDVKVASAGKFYDLASTQEHYAINAENMGGVSDYLNESIEDAHLKRFIIQEGTIEQYKANPNFLHDDRPHYPTVSLDRPHKYEGVKWGMSIDLNKCTGCGDCVIACNVENNIPVVGKDQVKMGREMHWMRIDRYYSGSTENPTASIQPMLCQHCDNAPCENVCPVVATSHSPEGINEMTYNRCVGTRYCANNCPYKVRRFNFYNFRDHFAGEHQEKPVFALLHNPEVTVRSRGVMEKCSFCVQRVNNARAASKRNHEEWNGQGMVTACQESCSSNAIAFGNLNDTESTVATNKKHKLTYRVLDETAVESNVRYIAKIRNIEGKSHS